MLANFILLIFIKLSAKSINFKEDIVYEYIDIITTSNEEKYINAMTLVSDDYSISFIMKLEYAPNSIKEQL